MPAPVNVKCLMLRVDLLRQNKNTFCQLSCRGDVKCMAHVNEVGRPHFCFELEPVSHHTRTTAHSSLRSNAATGTSSRQLLVTSARHTSYDVMKYGGLQRVRLSPPAIGHCTAGLYQGRLLLQVAALLHHPAHARDRRYH
eukprot:1160704-Pelagomonas_calceolata.AAC.5